MSVENNILLLVAILFLATCLPPAIGEGGKYPTGDLRNCPTAESPVNSSQPLYRMEVLPGTGFDSLRDIDMGQVLNRNYSQCHVSNDGKYLLPDDVYLSPIRRSKIEEYADYFDHWSKYTSLTSETVSAHASVSLGFAQLSSSFSTEHSSLKSRMVNDESSVTRIHLKNTICSVHAQPRSPLHPDFKTRIFEIGAYLEKNLTDHAHYLAELLVHDYGTHYISSVKAGAIISQMDFVKKIYVNNYQKTTLSVKASASASFFGKVSIGSGFDVTTSTSHDNGYASNKTNSILQTIGGPPYRPQMTIDEWSNEIPNALVTIDRAGEPLYFVINSNTVPELRHETRAAVADTVYKAIKRYFKVNTHTGCTNPTSKNFDFQANIDDGECEAEKVPLNYTFGGAYQRCTDGRTDYDYCNLINQHNPLTNDYTCPDNYIPVKIFSGTIDIVRRYHLIYHRRYIYLYEAFWCVAKPETEIPVGSAFLFGGFYTRTSSNPLTNQMSCPQYFVPLKVGNYISLCVSTEYDAALEYAVPFGGFETCQTGNPLARKTFSSDPNTWPHQCPQGYTSYFGAVEHGCDINICIKSGAFKSPTYNKLLPPRLPPFHVHSSNPLNDSEILSFAGNDGKIWTRDMFGQWSNKEPVSQCYEDASTLQPATSVYTMATTDHNTTGTNHDDTTTKPDDIPEPLNKNNSPSTVAITLPTVLFGVLFGFVIALVLVAILNRFCKHRRTGYNNINSSNQRLEETTPA